MIIQCDRCYARYRYDEARFEGQASKKVRCTKCMTIFVVQNPLLPGAPAAIEGEAAPKLDDTATRRGEEARSPTTARTRLTTEERQKALAELKLPADAKLSLAVISGPQAGRIFVLEKPKVVIGRADADIVLEDPELSRQHAAVEVAGERVTLVDLGSTNGTYVDGDRITEVQLENQGEFTLGGSTVMLIITKTGA